MGTSIEQSLAQTRMELSPFNFAAECLASVVTGRHEVGSLMEQSLCFMQAHGLNSTNCILAGSAAAYFVGLLKEDDDGLPGDLDVICLDGRVFSSKCMGYGADVKSFNGFHGALVDLVGCRADALPIDLTEKWPVQHIDTVNLFDRSVSIQGVRVMHPIDVLRCYLQFDREKDQPRIEALSERMKSFNCVTCADGQPCGVSVPWDILSKMSLAQDDNQLIDMRPISQVVRERQFLLVA